MSDSSIRPRHALPLSPETLLETLSLDQVAKIVVAWEDAARCDEDKEPESAQHATIAPPRLGAIAIACLLEEPEADRARGAA